MDLKKCEQFGINMKELIHKGRAEAIANGFAGTYAEIFAIEFSKRYMNTLDIASKELAVKMKEGGESCEMITLCTSVDEETIANLNGGIVTDEELKCINEINTGLQFSDFGIDEDEIFIRAIKEMSKYGLSGRRLRNEAFAWRRNYIIGVFQAEIKISYNLIKMGWNNERIRQIFECSKEAVDYLENLQKRKPKLDIKKEAENLYRIIMWRWL